MIQEIRDMQARLAALERSQQRPTQEIRDDGDLRLRWGRQPDGAYTVRAHNAGGDVIADLLGLGPVVMSLPAGPTDGQVCRYRHTAGQPPWLCIWDTALRGGLGAWSVHGGAPRIASARGGTTTAVSSGYAATAVTGSPTLTVPVSGMYEMEVLLPIQAQTAGLVDLFVGLQRTTGELLSWAEYFVSIAQYQGAHGGSRVEPLHLTAGWTMRACLASGTTSTWGHSSSAPKIIRLHPVELRP